jgi:hypothetical protein
MDCLRTDIPMTILMLESEKPEWATNSNPMNAPKASMFQVERPYRRVPEQWRSANFDA